MPRTAASLPHTEAPQAIGLLDILAVGLLRRLLLQELCPQLRLTSGTGIADPAIRLFTFRLSKSRLPVRHTIRYMKNSFQKEKDDEVCIVNL